MGSWTEIDLSLPPVCVVILASLLLVSVASPISMHGSAWELFFVPHQFSTRWPGMKLTYIPAKP